MSSEAETVPITHEYVADATFPSRVARSYTKFLLGRPPVILALVIMLVVGAGVLVAGIVFDIATLTIIGAIYMLVPFAFVLMVYLLTRSGNARRVPTGSRIALGLGVDAMRLEGPLGTAQTSYRAYSAVYLSGDFAILRLLGMRAYSLLPIELLPGEDFDTLRDAVARAQARA